MRPGWQTLPCIRWLRVSIDAVQNGLRLYAPLSCVMLHGFLCNVVSIVHVHGQLTQSGFQ